MAVDGRELDRVAEAVEDLQDAKAIDESARQIAPDVRVEVDTFSTGSEKVYLPHLFHERTDQFDVAIEAWLSRFSMGGEQVRPRVPLRNGFASRGHRKTNIQNLDQSTRPWSVQPTFQTKTAGAARR